MLICLFVRLLLLLLLEYVVVYPFVKIYVCAFSFLPVRAYVSFSGLCNMGMVVRFALLHVVVVVDTLG